MNPLPFQSTHKYYGDEWLEFHDYLSDLSYREGIFIELSFGLGLINPQELAYKTGAKEELLSRIKCLVEINREQDKSKHASILKKYNLIALPQPKNGNKEDIYG